MKGHSAGDTTEKYMRNNFFLWSLPLPSPPPIFSSLIFPFLFEPRQANLCLRAFRHDKF